jgi:hypothetical protein
MEVQKLISEQRVYHIIDSYQLLERNPDPYLIDELHHLLSTYPHAYLEIAIVECLVKSWSILPMPRGSAFLAMVKDYLHDPQPICLTSAQFRQITGLAPQPLAQLTENLHADIQP